MSFCRLSVLFIWLDIQALLTQSPPFFEWQYALWVKHNELRSQIATGSVHNQPFATNMEQILYESNLEKIPLNHALQCNYTHNMHLETDVKGISDQLSFKFSSFDQFGENIAYFELLNGAFLTENELQDIIEQQWFNYNDYDYSNHQCTSNATDCDSYQRLLWAKTRYMACGVSICPSLLFPHNDYTISNAVFIVCNYWPSYDKDELPIYTTTTATDDLCTNCPLDRSTECRDGLCVGCPAPNYYYCQDRISVCHASADQCDKDPVIQLYCVYTCFCTDKDWIPDTECNDLYLDAPIHDKCERLGWYDVQEIESDNSIKCEDGYTLPTMDNIEFVEDNCLKSDDEELLDDIIKKAGTDIRPNGIAIDWVKYDIGCDWNNNYKDGVIPAHNGIKCGDRKQLFICIQEDETDAPTDSPTEGPTFSPTIEPTDMPSIEPTTVPIFDTTIDVDVPATTDPFRMYLVFPDELSNIDARRLSVDDGNDAVNLYPLEGISVSLPIDSDVGFGYEFSLSKKVKNEMEVGLSQILYGLDASLCGMNDSFHELIKFKLLTKNEDEWTEIESIGYTVKAIDDIVIDIDDHSLDFDVLYMFVIDVSLLRYNCERLSHAIYAKSFGDFGIDLNHFMVNKLKSIMYSNGNNSNPYKYWMKMSIKFSKMNELNN